LIFDVTVGRVLGILVDVGMEMDEAWKLVKPTKSGEPRVVFYHHCSDQKYMLQFDSRDKWHKILCHHLSPKENFYRQPLSFIAEFQPDVGELFQTYKENKRQGGQEGQATSSQLRQIEEHASNMVTPLPSTTASVSGITAKGNRSPTSNTPTSHSSSAETKDKIPMSLEGNTASKEYSMASAEECQHTHDGQEYSHDDFDLNQENDPRVFRATIWRSHVSFPEPPQRPPSAKKVFGAEKKIPDEQLNQAWRDIQTRDPYLKKHGQLKKTFKAELSQWEAAVRLEAMKHGLDLPSLKPVKKDGQVWCPSTCRYIGSDNGEIPEGNEQSIGAKRLPVETIVAPARTRMSTPATKRQKTDDTVREQDAVVATTNFPATHSVGTQPKDEEDDSVVMQQPEDEEETDVKTHESSSWLSKLSKKGEDPGQSPTPQPASCADSISSDVERQELFKPTDFMHWDMHDYGAKKMKKANQYIPIVVPFPSDSRS